MYLFILLLFFICFVAFPTFRCLVLRPISSIYYGAFDLYYYIRRKRWREYRAGELIAYTGLFGKGKTLSAVHRVCEAYRRFDGLQIYCNERKKYVTQRIKILSNVELKTVPYERFSSLQQIIDFKNNQSALDYANDELTVLLVLGDEFSTQMNSRQFKTNLNPLILNVILTCRHYHISLFYTTQRFQHVDALLRQVTSYVIECNKLWRFQRQYKYDAWDMENAGNVNILRPVASTCWFVLNRDYNAYDTFAVVDNLTKDAVEGRQLTEKEILELQGSVSDSMEKVTRPSKGFLKRRRK